MKTKFAPAEREDKSKIRNQKGIIESSEFLDKVLSSSPFMFFILNDKRQVVYSNKSFMNYLGYAEMAEMIGFRPGELFSCVNSNVEPGGCGTAENCRYCGAVGAILESKRINEMVIKESIINIKIGGKEIPMNFEVSAKPFLWEGDSFFMVTLQNIAEKKRKEQLERTFFHDITNRTGNVSMFLDLIEKKYISERDNEMFKMVKQSLTDLMDDIVYQKKLQEAENGDLIVSYDIVNIESIIKIITDEYLKLAEAYRVQIESTIHGKELNFGSDKVLLKRTLGNLLKNAIEASSAGDIVKISFSKENNDLCFRVSNPAFIPADIQAQLFNRAFSTKGQGRGIGTYSIRLFTEQYLKGKVELHSAPESGTTFTIRIPVSQ